VREVKKVKLKSLIFSEFYYPRVQRWTYRCHSQTTVECYKRAILAGEKLPPIVVQEGTNIIIDGYHRYLAYKELGYREIEVEEREIKNSEELLLEAAALNSTYRLPLTDWDKKRVAERLFQEGYTDINRISEKLSVTPESVREWTKNIKEEKGKIKDEYIKARICEGATAEQVARELGINEQMVSHCIKKMQETEELSYFVEKRLLEDFEEAYDKSYRAVGLIGEEEIKMWASEIAIQERLKELKKVGEIRKFFEQVERVMHRTFALSRD
jgi:transposase-like protein